MVAAGRGRLVRLAGLALVTLRISTLVTLAIAVTLIATTPPGRYLVEASADEIEAALATTLAREFDPDWLDQTLLAALAEEPVNWTLVDSVEAVANERGLEPGANAAEALATAKARDHSLHGQAQNCLICAAGGAECRLQDGLICAIGTELTPIGDARALIGEGIAFAQGDPVDQINVTLSAVGLGATMAILVSGGTSAAVKGGTAILKTARRAGKLSPGLQALLLRSGRTIIHWDRLPRTAGALLDPAAYRAALNMPVATRISALAADLDRLRRSVPLPHAMALLGQIDTAGDARRISRLAAVGGTRTVAVTLRLGKARTLRLTSRLSRTARNILGLTAALAAQAAALALLLIQGLATQALRTLRTR